jgi:hypothetical protein
LQHEALHRRFDAGEARVESNGVEVRAGDAVSRGQVLDLFFGRNLVGLQSSRPLEVAARLLDRLGRLRNRGIDLGAFEHREQLALRDAVAGLHRDLVDHAPGLERESDLVARREHANGPHVVRQGDALDGLGAHRRRLRCRRLRGWSYASARGEQRARNDERGQG